MATLCFPCPETPGCDSIELPKWRNKKGGSTDLTVDPRNSFLAVVVERYLLCAFNSDPDRLGGEPGDEGGVYHLSRFGVVFTNRAAAYAPHEKFVAQERDTASRIASRGQPLIARAYIAAPEHRFLSSPPI